MLSPSQRRTFDDLLESIIDELPENLHQLLEEVPLIVEDEPSAKLMAEMRLDRRGTLLCGLHWGIALTQRSVEQSGMLPDRMMLFREPIMRLAGIGRGGRRRDLERQVRITLLHEMGHHFGLDEDDLAQLGYA